MNKSNIFDLFIGFDQISSDEAPLIYVSSKRETNCFNTIIWEQFVFKALYFRNENLFFQVFLIPLNLRNHRFVFFQAQCDNVNFISITFRLPLRSDSPVLKTFSKWLLKVRFQDFAGT